MLLLTNFSVCKNAVPVVELLYSNTGISLSMKHKERHILLGFMVVLGVALGAAVFIAMAYE